MSFVSKLDGIFRRLRSQLNLQDLEREDVIVPSLVLPVIELTHHLHDVSIKAGTIAISATGDKIGFTVPANEVWYLYSVSARRDSGTWTMDALQIGDGGGDELDLIFIAAQTHLETGVFEPLILEGGWTIGAEIDGFTGAGNMVIFAYVHTEIVN